MRFFRNLSIPVKILFIFELTGIMLTIAAGTVVIKISNQSLTTQIEHHYLEKAQSSINALNVFMQKEVDILRDMAQNEIFTNEKISINEITEYLNRKKEIYGYKSVGYLNKNSTKVIGTDISCISEEKQARFLLSEEFLIGKRKVCRCVCFSESDQEPLICLAVPIKDSDGNILGLITVKKDFSDIEKIFHEIKEDKTFIVLFDEKKDIIFTNCEILKKRQFIDKVPDFPSVQAVLSKNEGVIVEAHLHPEPEKEFFTAYAYERETSNLMCYKWFLLVAVEKNKVLAPLRRLRNAIMLILIVTVFIIVFIAGPVIARIISAPILRLVQIIESTGKGDLSLRAKVDSKDEIGMLGMAFNEMSSKLEKLVYSEKSARISEKKQKMELEAIRDDLETEVSQRTKELEEKVEKLNKSRKAMIYIIDDLNKTSKKLEETQIQMIDSERLATIGKMAGMVSHEIRNPLAAIQNSVYFLNMKLKENMDEKVKKHLIILQEEVTACDKIIFDILGLTKIKPPVLERTDINKLLKDVIKKMKIPKNINIKTDFNRSIPEIMIDKSQVKLVIINILSNAVDAIGSASGEIIVGTSKKKKGVSVTFKDSGPGVSEKDINKIFDPLFSAKSKGIGLGLTICKNIVENHKGRIVVKNNENKGALFVVDFPG
ncbi:MAG: ATP-binding protein [Candidatus Omnitrophota bacterium]